MCNRRTVHKVCNTSKRAHEGVYECTLFQLLETLTGIIVGIIIVGIVVGIIIVGIVTSLSSTHGCHSTCFNSRVPM